MHQESLRQEDMSEKSETRIHVNVWEVFWRRKWLVLLLLTTSLGLGYLYFAKQVPIYQSSASILVVRTRSQLTLHGLDKDDGTERQTALSTQAMLIRSPLVVGRAVTGTEYFRDNELSNLAREVDQEPSPDPEWSTEPESPPNSGGEGEGDAGATKIDESPARSNGVNVAGNAKVDESPTSSSGEGEAEVAKFDLRELPSLKGSRDPVSTIILGLSVKPARDSAEVLELTYKGVDPQDCKLVLEAVYSSYQRYLKGSRADVSENAFQLINKAQGTLSKQLAQKEENYRKFREAKAGLLFKGVAGANIHHARMTQIETARSEILLQHSQTSAQLKAIAAARLQGHNREALLLSLDKSISSEGRRRPEVSSLSHELLPFLLDEQRLIEDFGKDHPKVIAARNRIETTRRFFRQPMTEGTGGVASETHETDLLDVYIQALDQELATLKLKDKDLMDLFEKEQSEAKNLEKIEAIDEAYRTQISRKQQLFAVIIKRLEEINLAKDLGGYDATKISDAKVGSQVEPSLFKIMALATVFGLLVGFGLAYGVDLADKRFRDPDDVQRDLGLPLIGHVPLHPIKKGVQSPDDSSVSPMLITHHKPMSRHSEAYRAIRTSLFFNQQANARVIQVTSPSSGDGKSTLSANLAISMAQSMKRVLLIDADLRRPTVHKMFSLKRDVGLSSIIGGDTDWNDAIVGSGINNLWVLTCGPSVSNPSELLTSPRLKELLDALRERYDYIIIDSPPLLAVSDPSAIAPRVDGVLLVLRITKKSRQMALRASKLLPTLGANVLGVVINGVENARGYGNGYGYRGYGYGYGGRYGYGYGYGDRDAAAYYANDTTTRSVEAGLNAQTPHTENGQPRL